MFCVLTFFSRVKTSFVGTSKFLNLEQTWTLTHVAPNFKRFHFFLLQAHTMHTSSYACIMVFMRCMDASLLQKISKMTQKHILIRHNQVLVCWELNRMFLNINCEVEFYWQLSVLTSIKNRIIFLEFVFGVLYEVMVASQCWMEWSLF
jgi:hypothetical protein